MTKAYQRSAGWAAMLALSVLAAACAKQPPSQPQPVSAANATLAAGADRQGQFARPPMELQVCVAHGAKEVFSDLFLILNASPPRTLRAMSSRTSELNDWTIDFHDAGSGKTDVILRSSPEWKPDVGRIWRIVELCAEQG